LLYEKLLISIILIISCRAELEKANKVDETIPITVENDLTKDSNNQSTEEVSIFKFV